MRPRSWLACWQSARGEKCGQDAPVRIGVVRQRTTFPAETRHRPLKPRWSREEWRPRRGPLSWFDPKIGWECHDSQPTLKQRSDSWHLRIEPSHAYRQGRGLALRLALDRISLNSPTRKCPFGATRVMPFRVAPKIREGRSG